MLVVSVPVLSEQMVVAEPMVSHASRCLTRFWAGKRGGRGGADERRVGRQVDIIPAALALLSLSACASEEAGGSQRGREREAQERNNPELEDKTRQFMEFVAAVREREKRTAERREQELRDMLHGQ